MDKAESSAPETETPTAGGNGQNEEASSAEGSLTGTVQENKGFMITIVSDADTEPYVFPLDDVQSETYKEIKDGDKVTVSYSNGLPTPDNFETVVKSIQKAK